MGMNFFDIYSLWVDEIESSYSVPKSKYFQNRNFKEGIFRNVKNRRFFSVLRILAEHGPCTAREISRYYTAKNRPIVEEQNENEFYQLLNGRKKQSISLQDLDVVVASKSFSKDGREKKFSLSYFGIFYAIKLFFGSNIYEYSYPPFKNNRNFSDQKNVQTIIDVIAKNYTWTLPLIFGKWEYLKKNKYINAHYLAKLASDKYFIPSIPLDIFDDLSDDEPIHNLDHPFTNNWFSDEITARFYFEQQRLFDSPSTTNIIGLINNKEINDFIEKTFTKYQNYIGEHGTILKNYRHKFIKSK